MLALLALIACAAPSTDLPAADTGSDGPGPNPVVPEQYELLWDLNATSCEEDGAIVYFVFDGDITADGDLVGTETWYWFHSGEGWDDDCADVFSVEGTAGELNWSEDPCSGCDRAFLADWVLDEEQRGCSYGYEPLLDDDDTDRIDEEAYEVALEMDPLSPGGNINAQNLVFSWTQDDRSSNSYNARPEARGTYAPYDESDFEGAAHVTWTVSSGLCIVFE
jgi:hypothetical protein